MAKLDFNFYQQHDAYAKRNNRMQIMLPFIIVLVLAIISGFLAVLAIPENSSDYWLGVQTLLSKSSYWKWMLILFVTWYLSIVIWSKHILNEPIDQFMTSCYAEKIKPYERHFFPEVQTLDDVVSELAIAYGIKKPDVYIAHWSIEPNAFAITDSNGQSAVAITQSLLQMLNREELSGVIGHELAHIKANDSKTTLSFALYTTGLGCAAILGLALIMSGFKLRGNGLVIDIILTCLILIGFVFLVAGTIGDLCATILKFAMSRTREYDADAMSANINQSPDGLISALTKLDQWVKDYKAGKYDNEKYDPMYNPKKSFSGRFASLYFVSNKTHLFDDHPSTKDRIKRLKEIQ